MVSLFDQLCMACRIGDVDSVDKLLLTGVNVNDVDEFDYTPLYLASLCGHEPVVRLLLQRGAVCDTDKYEGVRCVYGALTDSIRNLLISFDISKATDTTLPFASHLRSLLESDEPLTKDIVLDVGGTESLRLHRFMLSARSQYFREKLLTKWKDKNVIHLMADCDEEAFKLVIGYLYLAHDPFKFRRGDQKLVLRYARKVQLTQLVENLQNNNYIVDPKNFARLMKELQLSLLESARLDFKHFVESSIIANKIETIQSDISDDQVEQLQSCSAFPDLIFYVTDSETATSTYYPVHRSVLIRDEYFKVMFSSSFSEAQDYSILEDLQIVDRSTRLSIQHFPVPNHYIAEIVLRFLYYDHTDIPLDHAVDVLFAGDLLLNDRLKTMAAVAITSSPALPDGYDLYDILRASWETRVERLEHFVAKKIASNLDEFIEDPEFHDIVSESAQRITIRQETDTIELIDDIRFYLAKKWNIDFDGLFEGQKNDLVDQLPGYSNYEMDMAKIEALLSELQLDA
ncbi:uncharacterized protein CYBJADRAFT_174649 [Cyberlindnera jadinii NRRL Y-1542]|uniref:BTB domain-containing protein n=1 Tax=Cyberlindnera jadinii (strain ATCC 18201 / CBS 1600 / BCRC 20928 / JCM 3617 / NBRC 0987 / NRRL Y-1542) TaxID=983966 RepID=A0A1E4RXM4_CYBJN|nr:hypothetical protein CYBJADRAFT_174649 [Cyberlindnera jadinii NRRL Y-1542]ODV71996.1 hypothetical protein CYBJADRAFT_174649 [Cyberlindnera jadinii NRRL Y-1542]